MKRLPALSRRDWLRVTSAGALGASLSGWFGALAQDTARNPQRRRSCILLWMDGGPSQLETFDVKPGQANGGPSREIATNVPGIRISEHLPQVARHMNRMAIIRSMSTRVADHGLGAYLMHTGHVNGPVNYPAMGALFAKELEAPGLELPPFISIAPRVYSSPTYGSGFLGPQHAPLVMAEGGMVPSYDVPGPGGDYMQQLRIQDVQRPAGIGEERNGARVQFLEAMDAEFVSGRPAPTALSHQAAYRRAVTLMTSAAASAFDIEQEPAALRDRYGRNLFGQGCLLARRLIERGVPFVEVTLNGVGASWDTHRDNFESVRRLNGVLDPAWAT